MNTYDDQYYFIRSDDDNERLPYLTLAEDSPSGRFRQEIPASGAAPFVFTNAWQGDFRDAGITEEVADILFESSLFLVRSHIRDRLVQHALPNVFFHPAVYVADDGTRHEDYWFVGFTARFDCWDRATSTYTSPPLRIGNAAFYSMHAYSLDQKILDATPPTARLLFQMGGTDDAMVVCHQSIASIFMEDGMSGVVLQPISQY